MSSDVKAHLQFFAELGVTGVSRDPSWRQREEAARQETGSGSAGTETAADPTTEEGAGAELLESLTEPAAGVEPIALAPAEALSVLRAEIGPMCTRCKLCNLGRRQVVFGVGNPKARLMF